MCEFEVGASVFEGHAFGIIGVFGEEVIDIFSHVHPERQSCLDLAGACVGIVRRGTAFEDALVGSARLGHGVVSFVCGQIPGVPFPHTPEMVGDDVRVLRGLVHPWREHCDGVGNISVVGLGESEGEFEF